jgi:hypothetical protein
MSKVVTLGNAAPDKALEGLNRLTGLIFESWPESLVGTPGQHPEPAAPSGEAKQVVRRASRQ